MKIIIGVLMCVIGVALGAYVGVWLCFIGGIVDVIQEIRADDLVALNIAIGVAKVLFSGVCGWVSGLVFGIPGLAMIQAA